jgi:hypothetical protein
MKRTEILWQAKFRLCCPPMCNLSQAIMHVQKVNKLPMPEVLPILTYLRHNHIPATAIEKCDFLIDAYKNE